MACEEVNWGTTRNATVAVPQPSSLALAWLRILASIGCKRRRNRYLPDSDCFTKRAFGFAEGPF